MVFSSTVFLFVFLPVVLSGIALLRKELHNTWLLVMSILFYAWGEPVYVLLMLLSIAGNYIFGLLVHLFRAHLFRARFIVAVAVFFNLALLGWFKYANFVVDNLNRLLPSLGIEPVLLAPITLPLGISFFTFQALSYVIDVYRGDGNVQRNPMYVGLYISVFPQLIAGPIVRFHDVMLQIHERVITLEGFASGIHRFVTGLAKKVLIANILAAPADYVFDSVPAAHLTPALAWLGVVCYSLQIYFDFSGYSDMAIGLGRMLGFDFLENFRYPYVSQSITEFWRRWHISLSTWFRDYLYIPLGGNRVPPWRNYLNLLIVFFLCGLWHGASWTFAIWGLYHGLFLVVERIGRNRGYRIAAWPIRYAYTLLVVMVGWTFFRADSFTKAITLLEAMIGLAPGNGSIYYPGLFLDTEVLVTLIIGAILSLPVFPALQAWLEHRTANQGIAVVLVRQWASPILLLGLFLYSLVHLSASTYNPFIYFRF